MLPSRLPHLTPERLSLGGKAIRGTRWATADMAATGPEHLHIDSATLEAEFARDKRNAGDGTPKSARVALGRHGKLAGVRTWTASPASRLAAALAATSTARSAVAGSRPPAASQPPPRLTSGFIYPSIQNVL